VAAESVFIDLKVHSLETCPVKEGNHEKQQKISIKNLVDFLSSDHLGPLGNRDDRAYVPGRGYGQGFGFYVRVDSGHAYFPGNIGEYYKGGAAGTVFWIDPVEDLIAVFMVSEPAKREYYRFKVKTLIYQAILE
jgi:CubicO group peptidase (beta-lactamase class C family)